MGIELFFVLARRAKGELHGPSSDEPTHCGTQRLLDFCEAEARNPYTCSETDEAAAIRPTFVAAGAVRL